MVLCCSHLIILSTVSSIIARRSKLQNYLVPLILLFQLQFSTVAFGKNQSFKSQRVVRALYSNGALRSVKKYNPRNQLIGYDRTYHRNGNLKTISYRNPITGKLAGNSFAFTSKGLCYEWITWKNGIVHGVNKRWWIQKVKNPKGKFSHINMGNGKHYSEPGQKYFFSPALIAFDGKYKDGKPTGWIKVYSKDGNLSYSYNASVVTKNMMPMMPKYVFCSKDPCTVYAFDRRAGKYFRKDR